MKLKFKILWFEDDPDIVTDEVGPDIEKYLMEQGFEFVPVHKLNGKELDDLIKDKTLDLIVTDLNLGEYETGEKLIDHIRDNHILTEVLLYSANVEEINKLIGSKGLVERVSFAVGIGNLPGKFKAIIDLIIRKVQDVNNMRGLVIAETIDLEFKIENILLEYFNATDDRVLKDKKTELLEHIYNKKIENHTRDLDEIKNVNYNDIYTLIEKDILTASNSFDAIQSVLKIKIKDINIKLQEKGLSPELKVNLLGKKEEIEILKNELNNFREEIIKIRNTLAHVKEEMNEEGIPFLESRNRDGSKILFTPDKYISIRKDILKHSKNLDLIIDHIHS